jgi:hypothetical protein
MIGDSGIEASKGTKITKSTTSRKASTVRVEDYREDKKKTFIDPTPRENFLSKH